MSSNPIHTGSGFRKKLLVSSVAAALGTGAVAAAGAELEEIVVTARQRSESSQDIPMMVQSLSGDQMERRGLTTLEDLSRSVAGLNVQSTTPGQNTIVFRGVSDGGGFLVDPTAAIYLGEQPMSLTSAAPDIYPVDLARVEALAGPQSTLYGASSQSGAIKYVPNAPSFEEIEGNVRAGLSSVSGGGQGYDVDGTINLPLNDKVAIRLSGFSRRDSGYIDNVLGNTVEFGDLGGIKDNSALLEEDINDVTWQGARAQIRWLVNEDWSANLALNIQKLESDGFNDFDANRGDLSVVKFADEYRKDDWTQTSLVIEGDLGFAQLVSATSYYDRDFLYQHDTQSYAAYFHYNLGIYYQLPAYNFGEDPTGYLVNNQNDKSFTQEFRLTGGTERTQWTLGAFYGQTEEFWDFHTYIDGYRDSPAFVEYWSANVDNLTPTDAWWNSFQGTERKDKAVFGEIDVDIIPERLTLLLGGRWYEVDRDLTYTVERPDDNLSEEIPKRNAVDDGFIPKIGLEFHINNEMMLYGLYSEGYRVGGTNRGRGEPTLPRIYESDILENTELGFKSQFADGRVQLNVVLYSMKWRDMQIEVTDPSFAFGEPFQIVVGNVGDAEVTGADLDLKALLGDSFEIGVNFTKLNDSFVKAPEFYVEPRVDGGLIETGLDRDAQGRASLPLFPKTSYSLYGTLRDINILGGNGVLTLQHQHVGRSLNQLQFPLPQGDYSTTDLLFNLDYSNWSAQLYVRNLSDERGIMYEDSQDFDQYFGWNSSFVIRPRSFGISLRRYF